MFVPGTELQHFVPLLFYTAVRSEEHVPRGGLTVETFGNNPANGNNDVQWLKVVDTRSREVFSYEPQIVPPNRTAVPAP